MPRYFIHNGYSGWSYGTPSDPQLISDEDALRLMQAASLRPDQVARVLPPAQYAETGDRLYELTGGNRFVFFGDVSCCTDVVIHKTAVPLVIAWAAA